ncbi:hypothetical protein [Massilia sp. BKSP1R2A-1]|uniref:hypothetical protein n=1 Tax=Massilia sp. BKSP1R2A-1 TaxID=3422595 RepID=UPI003D3377BB
MNTKKLLEEAAVEAYRAGTQQRRARQHVKNELDKISASVRPNVTDNGGVVTVQKPADAKPVSSLGGATKVFGTSRISIPESRHYAKRSR